MPDLFSGRADSVDGPARRLVLVVPSDTTDLTDIPRRMLVTATGTIAVVAVDDVSNAGVSLGTINAGTSLGIRARRILATGTTATIVLLL